MENILENAARDYARIKHDVDIDTEERYYNGHAVEQYETFKNGASFAVEHLCRCYCDDLCEKSRCGMCFHKYDGKYQVKNTFKYNECYELKMLRSSIE